MSLLTGPEIERLVTRPRFNWPRYPLLSIHPFVPEHVGPNSVDLRLAPELLVYEGPFALEPKVLDARKDNPTSAIPIPDDGIILKPGVLYLGSTVEATECHGLVPVINGRSSVGRLGVSVHVTAGFGDDGFAGTWTLEITAVHPVRVYAGMRICQVAFHRIEGERRPYHGRYRNQLGPVASRMHLPNGETS